MIPGNLVHPAEGGLHMYDSINPFGMYISIFLEDSIGIVIDSCYSSPDIDSCYSPSDVPYVQILNSDGIKGWVRYERVKVVR